VVADLRRRGEAGALVFAGFSQGTAMAWRAAARCGDRDGNYPAQLLEKDPAAPEGLGFRPEGVRFDGGHEWGSGFLEAAGRFPARIRQ